MCFTSVGAKKANKKRAKYRLLRDPIEANIRHRYSENSSSLQLQLYIMSVTIKIVCRHFLETQGLSPSKEHWHRKTPL